jgi:predicted GNAT family N-acyltransferase
MIYNDIDTLALSIIHETSSSSGLSSYQIVIKDKVYLLQHVLCSCNDITNTLKDIGRFRYDVWKEVTNNDVCINNTYGDNIWLDELDFIINSSRNFMIKDINTNDIIAVARMTYHTSFEDTTSRDLVIFKDYNIMNTDIIQSSCVDLGRLVVNKDSRNSGIGQYLNKLRMSIARKLNAKYIVVTASNDNAIRLKKLGFYDINKIVYFYDRPTVPFHCLQYQIIS